MPPALFLCLLPQPLTGINKHMCIHTECAHPPLARRELGRACGMAPNETGGTARPLPLPLPLPPPPPPLPLPLPLPLPRCLLPHIAHNNTHVHPPRAFRERMPLPWPHTQTTHNTPHARVHTPPHTPSRTLPFCRIVTLLSLSVPSIARYPSIALFLYPHVSLSRSVSRSLCLSLSLRLSVSPSLCLLASLSLSVSLPVSLLVSLCLCASASAAAASACLSVSLCHCVFVSQCRCLCLYEGSAGNERALRLMHCEPGVLAAAAAPALPPPQPCHRHNLCSQAAAAAAVAGSHAGGRTACACKQGRPVRLQARPCKELRA